MKSDVYVDLDSLKRDLRRGRDYRVRCLSRRSLATVIAPHGGFIEPGTSALARAIAGSEFSLFDFQGLAANEAFRLHVTSHRFRDLALLELLSRSAFALSIHGMPNHRVQDEIWLGGLNQSLRARVEAALRASGFSVNASPPRYKGIHPANIVNLCLDKGVQIELPLSLRERMFAGERLYHRNGRCPKTTEVFARFVLAIRLAVSEELQFKAICSADTARIAAATR